MRGPGEAGGPQAGAGVDEGEHRGGHGVWPLPLLAVCPDTSDSHAETVFLHLLSPLSFPS